eukprot:1619818-Pyramimonas_sp.AAC.2
MQRVCIVSQDLGGPSGGPHQAADSAEVAARDAGHGSDKRGRLLSASSLNSPIRNLQSARDESRCI